SDGPALPELPGECVFYRKAIELRNRLERHLPRGGKILVESGSFAQVAEIAIVDEATLSLIRSSSIETLSSIQYVNRVVAPLLSEEREFVRGIAPYFASVGEAFVRSVVSGELKNWGDTYGWMEEGFRQNGFRLARASGIAWGEAFSAQQARHRDGSFPDAGAQARFDAWIEAYPLASMLSVPWMLLVSRGRLDPKIEALYRALEEACEEWQEIVRQRLRYGEVLGAEVARILEEVLLNRKLEPLWRCFAWPIGPFPRSSYACTFDAHEFTDSRPLVDGMVWEVRVGAKQGEAIGWRSFLLEFSGPHFQAIHSPPTLPWTIP
ncbi:MAG: hypothetical protein NZM37_03855, partial [Sandaracinaceae bacterium]|nr:hypothetical protein [Sandaracinaceae bacterium]